MASRGVGFESSSSIEERKEFKRQARQEALEKAKQRYEKDERRKELKRQRGEDTWMLPEVTQRLQEIEEEGSARSKKKKEKKSKKKKEKKKREKKEKKAAGGSSDGSEDSEDEWIEAQPQAQAAKVWQSKPSESGQSPAQNPAQDPAQSPAQSVQRDEWMTFDFLAMSTTSTAERRAEKERLKEEERAKAQAIEQAGLHKLELNPYWKDGGGGLPPEETDSTAASKGPVVNDGGLGWLRKNYQRMKEQAERERRSLNDVVAERYGSMEKFQQRLADAEKAVYGQRREGGEGDRSVGCRWRKGENESGGRRSRNEQDGAEKDRRRRSEREKDSSSPTDRERYHSVRGEEERKGYRDREEERGRDREEERGRDREEERGRDREEERGRDREEERGRDREGFRERHRDGGKDRDRGEMDKGRCRDSYDRMDRDHENNGGRDRERNKDRERERPSSSSSSSSGQDLGHCSSSLGSLKSRFLKPSEDDGGEAQAPRPLPARPSTAFLKPSSDDEDSSLHRSSVPSWKKKSSRSVCESESVEKTKQEEEKDQGKSVAAPPDGLRGDEAAVTSVRSESESEEEEEEEVPLLSEDEMNKLGAKLVKAEIMGNAAMVEKLKSQLDAAHKAKENHASRQKLQETLKVKQVTGHASEDQEVLLFRTDESGRAWPVGAPSGPQEPRGGRRKTKPVETHVDGQRVRYFQDDDNMGLKEMVRREKMSSAQDQNALYSRMAAKMMGKTDGDNYTLDDMFVSGAAQREGEGREEERMRSRAIGESRRLASSMEKCRHCFSSAELQKHLIVAIGSKVYLSLPAGVSMAEGHCLISPLQHHCSATGLDEDVWSEIQLFRKTLVRMFGSQELDCVFMETHINPRRRQHLVLECVPLPRELGDMAPIYFKKAIMECDEEWAMNKKIVDLSSKDVRHAIPRGLPYFAVDFGNQGGFAHVIENEQKFPHYFGKEVVGGMMDLEPRRWRKLIRENFDDQRKKVLQFAQWWKPFDCTKTEG